MSTNDSFNDSVLLQNINRALSDPDSITKHEDVRVTLLDSTRKLTAALETPDEAVALLSFSPYNFMCVRLGVEIGLFDIIANKNGTITASELASQTQSESALIIRIMRDLTAMGFVGEAGEECYEATAITRHLTSKGVQAGIKHFFDQGLVTVGSMPEYFKKNGFKCPADSKSGPLQYAFNTDLESYAYWQTKPEVITGFNLFMTSKFGTSKPWTEFYPIEKQLIQGFDKSLSPDMFIDVGGGRGQAVLAVKTKVPHVPGKLTLEDRPEVINDIRELDENICRVKYDFFTPQPVQKARAYFFQNIFHNWSDPECLKILSNLVPVMAPNYSRLLISDFILPSTKCPLRAAGLDLGMMTLHSARQRSEKEWQELLEKAGLKVINFWVSPSREGIVEAIKVT
ncbi:MAG: hypothetical protein M1834_009202 [Cirrosporium novae-zelandiae]|nr:MAG: hypothetical protein M1834_009202 [Cirrosporium novae-zelandiae]